MLRRIMSPVSRAVRKKKAESPLTSSIVGLNKVAVNTLLRVPAYLLLRELIRDPSSIGAICASSALLANLMAAWIDPEQEGWVIELGGGTGAITAALLQRGLASDKLIVIEKSERLVQHLRKRFPDVRILQGDAANIGMATKECLDVSAVVSGLPLHSLPPDVVHKITNACALVLGHKGRLVQFTYWPRAASAWLDAGLILAASEMVWINLPPARVEVFTHSSIF